MQPLTDKGRQALTDYARTPVTVTPLKSEPLLRLLICDLVGEDVTRESPASLRDDIADLRRRLDDSERSASELPHREKYLLLATDFLRGLLDLHEQLVDDVERAFGTRPRTSSPANRTASTTSRSAARSRSSTRARLRGCCRHGWSVVG